MIVDPKKVSVSELHGYLLGVVAPRPIAFASTIDGKGNVNLSPFSFFNAFSANPPILVFSPARRGRDNTTKNTLDNVLEVAEVVINIVSHSIVEQMSLSSAEFEKDVDEFVKSGLTPVASDRIAPPRVGESPASFECKVNQVLSLGDKGAAGNLVICEVLLAHFKDEIFDIHGKINPFKLDAVARMGGNWYSRAQGESLFEIPKPIGTKPFGFDQLPDHVKNSTILSGNDLGRLANVEILPDKNMLQEYGRDREVQNILENWQNNPEQLRYHLHLLAKKHLQKDELEKAWSVILQS